MTTQQNSIFSQSWFGQIAYCLFHRVAIYYTIANNSNEVCTYKLLTLTYTNRLPLCVFCLGQAFEMSFKILTSKNNSKRHTVLKTEKVLSVHCFFLITFYLWCYQRKLSEKQKSFFLVDARKLTTKKLERLCLCFFPSFFPPKKYLQWCFVMKLLLLVAQVL